jgi:formate/nitrite transporter FocA (FNT family)
MTRAWFALCQGKVLTAIHEHLAAPLFFLAGVFVVVVSGAELLTGRSLLGPLWRRWGTPVTWFGLLAIMVGWGINLAVHFK